MNRVREARKHAKLSQQSLAERAGLSIGTISAVENGADVRLSTLKAIAAALDVPLSKLLVEKVPA